MERIVAVTGTLAPQESATLSAKVPGRVERLLVDIGSPVRQGDLIAQIEPRDYELRVRQAVAALAQARAAVGLPLEGDQEQIDAELLSSVKQVKAVLEEATRNVERVRNLTRSLIASAAELDTAEAAYKVALTRYDAALEDGRARLATLAQRRAELEIARKQLTDASVLAPFDGVIQSRPATMGEYVGAGTALATLVRTDPLRLRLEVPEREAMLVRAGQSVRLLVEGDTNTFTGQIARLSPAPNEASRMLLVEADVPNPGALRGRTVRPRRDCRE
jgi:RND family efflux transporter MFP subunit